MGALIGGLWNRAAGGFNDFNRNAIQWAMNTVNSIVRFFQDLPGRISGAIGNTGNAVGKALRIPGFAAGTSNFSGGMAIVGERGPELVNLPRGADVIPNNKIASVGGSGSTTININVGLMTGSAIERREAATRMFEDLKDIAGQRGQTVGQMIGA
jgi:phage-related tail protein